MAYKINRIGTFQFIAIMGAFDDAAPTVSVDSEPGVDGEEFTLEGTKGIPFSVFTVADCDDELDANIKVRAYKSLISFGTVTVAQNDEVKLDRYQVLNVTLLLTEAIASAIGNKKSNQARVLLHCRWDLVAVP